MPHLHLSLQSGADPVLARMRRPYTCDDFRAKADLIRTRLDRPAITTDIIVGFPGETDADFQQTLALAREVTFAKIHVFPFSPRPGTAAARMQPKIPPDVTKRRSQILRDLDRDLQRRFREQFIDQTARVLIETANGTPSGRAERYFPVRLTTAPERPAKPDNNELITVRIAENAPDAALATLLPETP
jgi:threonylcarbamoyladenosine tRNA methylthiotransferase MtaB